MYLSKKEQNITTQQEQNNILLNSTMQMANTEQKDGLSELVQLMKILVRQTAETSKNKQHNSFEIEPRNKEVLVTPPPLSKEAGNNKQLLKQWMAQVTKTVFSSAFYYHSKGEMNFEQAKVFCSQNILKNISALNRDYPLDPEEFQAIDKHLVKKVLPYLGKKYPLTDSSQINKKLQSMVEEIDNIEEMENNYFNNSKLGFEFRKDGNYNDIIMKVVNDLLERIDTHNDNGRTNHQEFDRLMNSLFSKVYSYEWMNKNLDEPNPEVSRLQGMPQRQVASRIHSKQKQHPRREHSKIKEEEKGESLEKQSELKEREEREKERQKERELRRQARRKKEQQEKYKNTVKEYTSFLIGRKIPENVPLFTNEEISQNKINIKHPAILRILTKWFEELWKKFQKNYFSNSSESFKLQKGDQVLELKPEYKALLDKYMAQQKQNLDSYIKNIEKLNYKLESYLLKIEPQLEGQDQMDQEERICGKFAYKIVKNLHKEIIEYLNKVIHSLLSAAKRLHEHIIGSNRKNEAEKANWPYPPNLISFKVGDLLRCKLSSKEQEIIKIYQQLQRVSQLKQNEKYFKIVRVKNRLKSSTNDLLINVRFNQNILCEIQLAIKSHASEFIKTSNAFHHYIYQLQRSQFGPLTELCSIWMSLDDRAEAYQQLICNQDLSTIVSKKKQSCDCSKYLQQIEGEENFICNRCSHIRMRNNYILKHLKCQNCRDYFVCAKCRIFDEDFEVLKNKLTFTKKNDKESSFNKLLRDNCLKLINKSWSDFEKEPYRYGVAFFIQSSKLKAKKFKLVVYNNQTYLLGRKENGEFFEIAQISDSNVLRQFCTQNILMQIKEDPHLIQFDDITAVKEYILPKLAKINYKKYKQNIALHLKDNQQNHKLGNQDCQRILMTGLKPQREKVKNLFASDNQLTKLPITQQDFPNLEWLVLSRNPIESLKGIEQFKSLKTFVLQNQHLKDNQLGSMFNKFPLSPLLEKLVLSKIMLKDIPKEFTQLKNLKILVLQNCKLNNIESLSQCESLENINLSRNQINTIPTAFSQLPKLDTLILHRNPIQLNLSEYPILDKTSDIALTFLDLSHCGINQIPQKIQILTNLQILNLEANQLKSISTTLFKKMNKLRYLNLSNNQITTLPDLSFCPKLTKLHISYTLVQELPAFLNNLKIEEFKFEGCPLKRIDCIHWLKEVLDQDNSILQKYKFWMEKIPQVKQMNSHSKCSTKIVNNEEDQQIDSDEDDQQIDSNEEDKYISQDEEEQEEEGEKSERKMKLTRPKQQQSQDDKEDELSEGSQSANLERQNSQSSNHLSNFFRSAKSRISFNINQEEQELSQSDISQEDEEQIDVESAQNQFEQQDMNFQKKLTKEVVNQYFSKKEMFVFDFQSKIRYSDTNTLFSKEINLYHDQQDVNIPLTFQRMIKEQGIKYSTLNVYAGEFAQHVGLINPNSSQVDSGHPLIYKELKKDKLPFTYAATFTPASQRLEIINTDIKEVPTHLFTPQLQQLKIYKTNELPQEINLCTNLLKLKLRQSQLVSLKAHLELLNLEELDLKGNQIETIEPKFFDGLPQLKVAILAQNKIKQVPNLLSCKQLENLDLADNPIDTLPDSMPFIKSLKSIQLHNCPLKTIKCKEWLSSLLSQDEVLVQESQLFLWKSHCRRRVRYQSKYTIHQSSLLDHKHQNQQQQYSPYSQLQQKKMQDLLLYNLNEKQLLEQLKDEEFLAFRIILKNKFQQKNISMLTEIKIAIDQQHPETAEKIQALLKLKGFEKIPLTVNRMKFIDLPNTQNPHCEFCKLSLTYPFYWLKWEMPSLQQWLSWSEKPKFACRQCIQEENYDGEFYNYKNNCILLMNRTQATKMPADYIGKNIQPKALSKAIPHSFQCNGCGCDSFKVGEPRYLCLGCKASHTEDSGSEGLVDLCQACMNKLVWKDKQLMKSLKKQGHRPRHSFLRILFNTQGYYIY